MCLQLLGGFRRYIADTNCIHDACACGIYLPPERSAWSPVLAYLNPLLSLLHAALHSACAIGKFIPKGALQMIHLAGDLAAIVIKGLSVEGILWHVACDMAGLRGERACCTHAL